MKIPEKTVIWPIYFNLKKTRSQGRRVPKRYAVESPQVNEIAEALKRRKHPFQVVKDKAFPRLWWETSGYILVEKKGRAKQDILITVGRELINLRQRKMKKK